MSEGEKDEFQRYETEFWEKASVKERQEIVKEHIERARKGREVWNKWTGKFVARVGTSSDDAYRIYFEDSQIEEIDFSNFEFPFRVLVIFRGAKFSGCADFEGALFADEVDFENAEFLKTGNFRNVRFQKATTFKNVSFSGGVDFLHANFSNLAEFESAHFSEAARFADVSFGDFANFEGAYFEEEADFYKANFAGGTIFHNSKFVGNAVFQSTIFGDYVSFDQVVFSGDAQFSLSTFKSMTDLRSSDFSGVADFSNVSFNSQIVFSDSKFKEVPNFDTATFRQPPQLSNMYIPDLGNESSENVSRYRKLKEMAISNHDHEQELKFFAYEMKAKRRTEQRFIVSLPGYLYQWCSNFGQSILRPFIWLISIMVFSYAFLEIYLPQPELDRCKPLSPTYSKIAYVTNQTVPFVLPSNDERKIVNDCLFGHSMPPGPVKVVSVLQSLFSAFMLFFLVLGARNRFKIK